MATDHTPRPDIVRLNAFVDGELSPSERAVVAAQIKAQPDFARAHATLARLKACIGESADATALPAIGMPHQRPHRVVLRVGVAALVVCCLVLAAVLAVPRFLVRQEPVPLAARDAAITLAALPASPVLPNLGAGGLTLEDVKIERIGEVRALLASYRGPHGCVLDLRVSPAASALPAGAGSSRHSWQVGPLAYEVVAHGMPGWRFAVIADAVERETRDGRTPDAIQRGLREARAAAPPCAG